jgi:hypothetical protein
MLRILGFDVRYAPETFLRDRWDQRGRELYLIDPKVPVPLSVDRLVWPSRFRMAGSEPPPITRTDDILVPRNQDTAHFEAFDVWPSFGMMFLHHKPTPKDDVAIAIGLVEERAYGASFQPDSWWRAAYPTGFPESQLDPAWTLLGFDAANSGMLSALTNCGRTGALADSVRAAWGGRLTDHGLLREAADAVEFAEEANRWAKEDGPFYAFSIHLVWGAELLRG